MTIRLYNTLGRKIEDLDPIEPGRISLYTCGPTVWDYAHIGNLRTYVFEDILKRTLTYAGYDVHHVMNITDVGHLTGDGDDGEDKMIKGARQTGRTVWEIAEHYTDAFFRDTDSLNICRPDLSCKATDHIDDMIGLIKRLDEKGFVYESGGNVYFDTSKSERYGELALLDRQKLKAGARIAVDANKRNPADFVLWFTRSKFEHQVMVWDSPWGRGYPGWHIECSAMSMKYLGDRIDIHCGGIDHIPVHHTNEIAQSESATGHKWVNIWMHGEFLLTGNTKMGKSNANFQTLTSVVETGYDPLDYRFMCLGAHYRSQLQFTDDALNSARGGRKSLNERVARMRETSEPCSLDTLGARAAEYLSNIDQHLSNDLGVPQALAELWGMLRDDEVGNEEKLAVAFRLDEVLGLGFAETGSKVDELEPELADMISRREQARAERDFETADALRDRLAERGIQIEDTADGTRWSRA